MWTLKSIGLKTPPCFTQFVLLTVNLVDTESINLTQQV